MKWVFLLFILGQLGVLCVHEPHEVTTAAQESQAHADIPAAIIANEVADKTKVLAEKKKKYRKYVGCLACFRRLK